LAKRVHFLKRLLKAPSRPLHTRLVRRVPMLDMIQLPPINFLFTSGKANRFNTAGIECIYFAEDEETARAEYERHNLRGDQPVTTYFADVRLTAILDLCDPSVRKACGVTLRQMRAAWVGAARPTEMQLIGKALSRQAITSAVRYPSEAARKAGFPGACVVIFRDAIKLPDSLRISALMAPRFRNGRDWLSLLHSAFDIRHSTFDIRHSTFDIRHSTFDIRHSTFGPLTPSRASVLSAASSIIENGRASAPSRAAHRAQSLSPTSVSCKQNSCSSCSTGAFSSTSSYSSPSSPAPDFLHDLH
jgi:RES domain-containing protein